MAAAEMQVTKPRPTNPKGKRAPVRAISTTPAVTSGSVNQS
jgi:hypothetical protein